MVHNTKKHAIYKESIMHTYTNTRAVEKTPNYRYVWSLIPVYLCNDSTLVDWLERSDQKSLSGSFYSKNSSVPCPSFKDVIMVSCTIQCLCIQRHKVFNYSLPGSFQMSPLPYDVVSKFTRVEPNNDGGFCSNRLSVSICICWRMNMSVW